MVSMENSVRGDPWQAGKRRRRQGSLSVVTSPRAVRRASPRRCVAPPGRSAADRPGAVDPRPAPASGTARRPPAPTVARRWRPARAPAVPARLVPFPPTSRCASAASSPSSLVRGSRRVASRRSSRKSCAEASTCSIRASNSPAPGRKSVRSTRSSAASADRALSTSRRSVKYRAIDSRNSASPLRRTSSAASPARVVAAGTDQRGRQPQPEDAEPVQQHSPLLGVRQRLGTGGVTTGGAGRELGGDEPVGREQRGGQLVPGQLGQPGQRGELRLAEHPAGERDQPGHRHHPHAERLHPRVAVLPPGELLRGDQRVDPATAEFVGAGEHQQDVDRRRPGDHALAQCPEEPQVGVAAVPGQVEHRVRIPDDLHRGRRLLVLTTGRDRRHLHQGGVPQHPGRPAHHHLADLRRPPPAQLHPQCPGGPDDRQLPGRAVGRVRGRARLRAVLVPGVQRSTVGRLDRRDLLPQDRVEQRRLAGPPRPGDGDPQRLGEPAQVVPQPLGGARVVPVERQRLGQQRLDRLVQPGGAGHRWPPSGADPAALRPAANCWACS